MLIFFSYILGMIDVVSSLSCNLFTDMNMLPRIRQYPLCHAVFPEI
jgi:hypothetical protein